MAEKRLGAYFLAKILFTCPKSLETVLTAILQLASRPPIMGRIRSGLIPGQPPFPLPCTNAACPRHLPKSTRSFG